jgi:hypothetical protein
MLVTTSLDLFEALAAPRGTALLRAIAAGRDEAELRLGERLRAAYPPELVAAALTLTELRAAAAGKFRLAAQMWFTREGLEQASSDALAAHHADRLPEGRLADLCCGIGGDLTALGDRRDVLAVDRDPVHARMAQRNAAVYGHDVESRCGDALRFEPDGFDAVYVDPARRSGGRRLRAGASLPPLGACLELTRTVPAVGIRAAPGLPLDLVPPGWEAEFVSEAGDLKESLLWSPALATTPRRATVLPSGATLVARPGRPVPCAAPGDHLLDPDPAVTRAGLVEELARDLGAWKIDEQVAFLSADRPLRTPLGRSYRIDAVLPFALKPLRAHLRERGIGRVDVRKRGSAVDVDDLRRRLRLDGDAHATVVLTRVADRPTALVCTLESGPRSG